MLTGNERGINEIVKIMDNPFGIDKCGLSNIIAESNAK